MATLKKVIKVTKEQYNILSSGGRVGDYVGLNDDYIYLIEDNSEYVDVTTVDFPNVATYLDWDTTYTLGAVAGQHIRVTMPKAPVYSWSDIPDTPSTFPPSAHNHSAAEITSGTLVDARIPSLSANKITSGTFAIDRIPNIPLSKITDVSNIGTTAVSTKTISTNSASIASGNTDLVTGGAIYSYVENEGGKVKSIKVNNTTYNPENGVITLPTYPSVSDSVITIKQAGISDQTFTLNGSAKTITLVDKDTTYSAGSGLTLDGTTFKHSNSITAQNTQAVYPVKIDSQGHISSYGSAVTSMPASDVYSWAKAATKPAYSFSEISDRYEHYLSWGAGGGKAGYFGPIDAALIDQLRANRVAGISGAAITLEKSNDGGSSWTTIPTSTVSNGERTALFTTSSSSFNIRYGSVNKTTDRMRITMNATDYSVYTQISKIMMYVSTSGSTGCKVFVETASYSAPTTWITVGTYDISGWSGWNILNLTLPGSGALGGSNYGTHNKFIRFTFSCTGVDSTYTSGLYVYKIYMFGGVGWTTPSSLAANGVPYSYDYSLNVNFPANVNAITFSENGTQLADKYATKSHTHTALSNRLALNPGSDSAQNSYNEGVRVNQASNGWANAVFGGSNGTTQGTGSGVWLVGRRGAAGSTSGAVGDFTIEHNGSNGTGLTLYADGSRPKWNNKGLAYTTDIPTVNNATLTIQKNGTSVQTFSANASTNVTCNITVPTVITDLTGWSTIGTTAVDTLSITTTVNSSSTSSQIPTAKAVWDVANTAGKVKEIQISGVTQTISPAGVVNLPAYPTTLPASDVSAWAKAANKPSYTLDEVSDGSSRKLSDYATKTQFSFDSHTGVLTLINLG